MPSSSSEIIWFLAEGLSHLIVYRKEDCLAGKVRLVSFTSLALGSSWLPSDSMCEVGHGSQNPGTQIWS